MKEYDVIIIGSGSGMNIVSSALLQRQRVALVDKGPLGGTCLNLGCIPSKMLTFPADRIMEIKGARKLGIEAEIKNVDFNSIMRRAKKTIQRDQEQMRKAITGAKNLDFYEGKGRFVGAYTLQVNNEEIKGRQIFIACGARSLLPPIKGIDDIEYFTNESLLELRERPKSVIIIGGGYVGVEYGHFFAAMGTAVTILEKEARILLVEEPEISELLEKEMQKRMDIHTNIEVIEVKKDGNGCAVIGKERDKDLEFKAEKIILAVGRKPNTDLLKLENTAVETDEKGFIKVDDYFKTSKENIWAFGDVIGKQMLRHLANREARLAWHNATHDKKIKMNYQATPHAVFTYPQIASVGLTEEQAKKDYDVLIGKARYSDIAKGEAMREEETFSKAVVERASRRILGFHIVGPYAPILIQEVVNVMAGEENISAILNGMHIHPALSELILATLKNLKEP